MNDLNNQLVQKIKASNAILITVSKDPSIDQLSGCIALTLMINKLKKHSTAVFSGQIPSVLEFLKPESTIDKNPESLRDFIVSLDKNKADKLKFKEENDLIKIYITPYKTALSEEDFSFSPGEFNIDLIIALGVKNKSELDQAIVAHNNILHDATIISINLDDAGDLGAINIVDKQVSSYCEFLTAISKLLADNILDEQISTALLTGIVAETERFSNTKTTPLTMSLSSELMKNGANPKLVATELMDNSLGSIENSLDTSEEPNIEESVFGVDHQNKDILSPANSADKLVDQEEVLPTPVTSVDPEQKEPEKVDSEIKSQSEVSDEDSSPQISKHEESLSQDRDSSLSEVSSTTQPLINSPEDINATLPDLATQLSSTTEQPADQFGPPPSSWRPSSDYPQIVKDNLDQLGSTNTLSSNDNSLSSDPLKENDMDSAKDAQNQTGLDQSLFSEPSSIGDTLGGFSSTSQTAPPVPPPVMPMTFDPQDKE